MKQIQCIIIEDELPARELLGSFIQDVPGWELQAGFTNAIEAIGYLSRNQVDVIFLDIQLPKLNGISFLRTVQDPPLVVITTAYSEHAVEAFELTVFDYLLKPYPFERFLKTVNRINTHFQDKRTEKPQPGLETITIRENRENIKLPVSEIKYVESQKEYVLFVCEGQTFRSRMSMAQVEEVLDGKGFLRIHRSFLIAVFHIDSYSRRQIKIGGESIPIGRYYQKEVQEKLGH